MKNILIVDDEKNFRDILKKKLEQQGQYKTYEAENGEVALNFLKNNNVEVDLILLDLFMPIMDGLTFYYHLKNTINKNIPVVILTNLTETPYPTDIKDFLIKSNTSLNDLVEKVSTHVA